MNNERPEPLDERVLVLAPTARDAIATRDLLKAAGLANFVCHSLADVCREATRGAGAAVITAEAILGDKDECLSGWLKTQPPWSDLPLIVLTPPGNESPRLLGALEAIGPMTLMKRPVHVSTLVSTIRSALRDRQRQHAVRDLLDERRRDAEALRAERERYRVTLASIGDAVVTTDTEGRVTFLNPVAEQLTGWDATARGRPLEEIVRIVNEKTRQPEPSSVLQALQEGAIIDPLNHTLLLGKDGAERPIDDRAAPIRDAAGEVVGGVLVFRDISAKKRAEAEVRAIFEGSMDAIVTTNDEGNYVEANPSACELFGLSREELLGRRISDYAETNFPFAADWQSFLEAGHTTGEFRIVRPDGTVKETEFAATAHILPGRHLSIIRDVTERKQAAEVLRQSEERHRFLADVTAALVGSLHYQSILRQVAELSVPTLGDFCFFDVVTADDRLERVGWKHIDPGKKVLSERVRTYVPARDDPNHPIARTLRRGEAELVSDVTDTWLHSAALSPEHLEFLRELDIHSVMMVPMLVGERRHGILTFCYSLSGRRHTPEELRLAQEIAYRAALTVENAKLFNQLKETDRKKDEFLAVLAHELRNPLAPLTNALQIMRLTAMTGQAAQVRDMMQRQVQQMTRLVDDLLDVSRITSGKIALQKERLDVSEVMLAALETSRPLIDAANHKLTVSPPPVPLFVEGDKTRLAQVVSNLLTNSSKYTPEGGHIWLSVQREGPNAVLRVRDTGMGIPTDMLPHIFEMFTQVARNMGRAQGGLGIGLTLVQSLVEMHGGTITARSDGPGQGSEFSVRLPLAPEQPVGQDVKGEAAAAPASKANPVRRRILVVDDNVDSAESLALLLRLLGHEVRTVHDGPDALGAATAFAPEVILLDIGLPGMDGYEVARRLRAMPSLQETILVAQTGWGQAEDRRRSEQAGFNQHFTKPVDPAALQRLLASLKSGE